MHNTKQEMEKLLAKLLEKRLSANKEIEELPFGKISSVKRNGKDTFFQVDDRRKRKSINRNQEIIRGLARKKYLQKQLSLLNSNIKAVEAFLMDYRDISADDILKELPKPIRQYCFSCSECSDNWGDALYRQSNYMPERKTHTTSRGLKVRSKSEALIAEKLYDHGIEFRYEQILEIEQLEFAPDFTVMTDGGRLIYWEHCGLTGSKKYMERHKRKLEIYERADIVPWKNLIVTYDDQYGNINMNVVESEIKCKIKGG